MDRHNSEERLEKPKLRGNSNKNECISPNANEIYNDKSSFPEIHNKKVFALEIY